MKTAGEYLCTIQCSTLSIGPYHKVQLLVSYAVAHTAALHGIGAVVFIGVKAVKILLLCCYIQAVRFFVRAVFGLGRAVIEHQLAFLTNRFGIVKAWRYGVSVVI